MNAVPRPPVQRLISPLWLCCVALRRCRDLPPGAYLQRLTYLSLCAADLQQLPQALLAATELQVGRALRFGSLRAKPGTLIALCREGASHAV